MERRPRGGEFYWQVNPHDTHDEWWNGPLHAIVFVLLLILLIGGVVWLVRRLSPGVAQAAAPTLVPAGVPAAVAIAADPAVSTLRMRYAKGEVSREDFRHAMEDLTGVAEPTAYWPGDSPTEDTAADAPATEGAEPTP